MNYKRMTKAQLIARIEEREAARLDRSIWDEVKQDDPRTMLDVARARRAIASGERTMVPVSRGGRLIPLDERR